MVAKFESLLIDFCAVNYLQRDENFVFPMKRKKSDSFCSVSYITNMSNNGKVCNFENSVCKPPGT